MKKVFALISALVFFYNLNMVGSCTKIPEAAINSIYLPKDSWVITVIKNKTKDKYKLADDLENKIAIVYCVQTNVPEVIDIDSIIEKSVISLDIPLSTAQNRCKNLSCTLTFDKQNDNLAEMLNNNKKPKNAKLEILNPTSNCVSEEIEKIDVTSENIEDFKLNDDTKIYPTNVGKVYQGHIFKDSNGKSLFYCVHGDDVIQKGKFHEVSKVLELYNKKLTQIHMMKKL